MTDPNTFTAEHRSFEWELMLQYEDGSLPASAWNESTLAIVAGWYAKNLTREQATTRYELHYQRNRHRLTHRLDSASVNMAQIEALDGVWQSLLTRVLPPVS
ncbi:MAG: hypothetical protein ABI852_17820 [Gemmatimonadaceae bacterium]